MMISRAARAIMQESQLRPAIALSEWMDGVEFTQKCGGLGEERFAVNARQEARRLEAGEHQIHLRTDSGKQKQLPPFAVRTVR